MNGKISNDILCAVISRNEIRKKYGKNSLRQQAYEFLDLFHTWLKASDKQVAAYFEANPELGME